MVTYESARTTIMQVIEESGRQGISALDLFTEVINRLEDDADPMAVIDHLGLEPTDIFTPKYH